MATVRVAARMHINMCVHARATRCWVSVCCAHVTLVPPTQQDAALRRHNAGLLQSDSDVRAGFVAYPVAHAAHVNVAQANVECCRDGYALAGSCVMLVTLCCLCHPIDAHRATTCFTGCSGQRAAAADVDAEVASPQRRLRPHECVVPAAHPCPAAVYRRRASAMRLVHAGHRRSAWHVKEQKS